jgi:hypothetical protein
MFIPLVLISSCRVYKDRRNLYYDNIAGFTRINNFKDSLLKRIPGCYTFSITNTAKEFYTDCDSVRENFNLSIPVHFLDKEETAFFSEFMYDCSLRYIVITPQNIKYIFDDYDPDIIVRTKTKYNDFKQFQLDSLSYLIPNGEKLPE